MQISAVKTDSSVGAGRRGWGKGAAPGRVAKGCLHTPPPATVRATVSGTDRAAAGGEREPGTSRAPLSPAGGDPPCVSGLSLGRLPSPASHRAFSVCPTAEDLLPQPWHLPSPLIVPPTAHDARTPNPLCPGQRTGKLFGSWAGVGGIAGWPHSHPPRLKPDAAGEADGEINWAFSKARRRGEAIREPPASVLRSVLREQPAAAASGSMVPAALGALLALLPLASTLQSPGKERDPWAGLGSRGGAGCSWHGAAPSQSLSRAECQAKAALRGNLRAVGK